MPPAVVLTVQESTLPAELHELIFKQDMFTTIVSGVHDALSRQVIPCPFVLINQACLQPYELPLLLPILLIALWCRATLYLAGRPPEVQIVRSLLLHVHSPIGVPAHMSHQ